MSLFNKKPVCNKFSILLLGLLIFFGDSKSHAGNLNVETNVAAKSEYTDNLFFQYNGNTVEDYINTISPGLKASFRDADVLSELSGRADIIKYKDNDDLDSVDDEFSGIINYKINQRMSVGGSGRYINSSKPDYYVEETGLAVIREIERKIASCKTEYYFNESIFSSLEYSHDNFQYREFNKPGSETNSANLVIGRNLGEINQNLVSRLTMGYSRSSYEGLQIDSINAFAGLTKSFNEKWSISIDAGGNNIKSDFDSYFIVFDPLPTLVDMDNDSNEWMVFSNIDYKGELSSLKLSFSRSVNPAPERSGAVERLSAGVSGNRRITEDLSFKTAFSYYMNNSDKGQFSTSEIDEESIQIRPTIIYIINRYFTFETTYKYIFIKNKITDNDATQNVVYCRFFAGYPVFE